MAFELGSKEQTALVLLDLQNDLVNEQSEIANYLGLAKPASAAIGNVVHLLEAFREAKLPVVHVIVDFSVNKNFQLPRRGHFFRALAGGPPMLQSGTWGGEIHASVRPLGDEPVVAKPMFSAFAGTNLHELLRSRNVSQLVLAGVATDIAVEATVWSAVDLGYDVIVAGDGCASADPAIHAASAARMAARADIADVDSIVSALQ